MGFFDLLAIATLEALAEKEEENDGGEGADRESDTGRGSVGHNPAGHTKGQKGREEEEVEKVTGDPFEEFKKAVTKECEFGRAYADRRAQADWNHIMNELENFKNISEAHLITTQIEIKDQKLITIIIEDKEG